MRAALMRFVPQSLRAMKRGYAASYAQYGEDIVFERLLRPGSSGTYVDVGSHDPVFGSNTYALYRKGWRGVTIDPNPAFAASYREWRGDELHLVEGVAKSPGALPYFEYANSVFNTFSGERAAAIEGYGEKRTGVREIPCRPLQVIVEETLGARQIDLLTVDCEGLDLEVLESLDFAANRPTTIIVEDYDRYRAYRDGSGESALHDFLGARRYAPIAQLAYSAIYVAEDWQELAERSGAFDPGKVAKGVLPKPV